MEEATQHRFHWRQRQYTQHERVQNGLDVHAIF
jgi:hypothetical protein